MTLLAISAALLVAWERNDVNAVVAMLADDARMAMPPLPTWYRGREQVAIFLSAGPLAGATRWRLIPVRANGQVAFLAYAWENETQAFMPHAINMLTLRGAQIQRSPPSSPQRPSAASTSLPLSPLTHRAAA